MKSFVNSSDHAPAHSIIWSENQIIQSYQLWLESSNMALPKRIIPWNESFPMKTPGNKCEGVFGMSENANCLERRIWALGEGLGREFRLAGTPNQSTTVKAATQCGFFSFNAKQWYTVPINTTTTKEIIFSFARGG